MATALAAGGAVVLERARVCATLEEALAGTVLAAGFTARDRSLSHPSRALRDAAPELLAAAQDGDVALVFGNETSGLSNDELGRCRLRVAIPANPEYGSLNLAAAVQVACYELACAAASFPVGEPRAPRPPPPTTSRRSSRTGRRRCRRAATWIPGAPGGSWSGCGACSRAPRRSEAR